MKTGFLQIIFLLISVIQINGQRNDTLEHTDSLLRSVTGKPDSLEKLTTGRLPDSSVMQTGKKLIYLQEDDPFYNPKSKFWIPALRVGLTNIANWAACRYYYKYDWAVISLKTWKQNLRGPWELDADGFHTNFWGHPHSGNLYFNVPRANGYHFWESTLFTAGGSLMWEVFLEKELPSINDFTFTTLGGVMLGETIYRISTSILDDRERGFNRVMRELLSGILNPPSAFNRLTNKKMFRVTPHEVYQKEPFSIRVRAGTDNIHNEFSAENHPVTSFLSIRFDYGDPFEIRKRKPFDVFIAQTGFFGVYPRKQSWFINGTALAAGSSSRENNTNFLKGIFQHFEYRFSKNYYLAVVGIGPGLFTTTRISPAVQFSSVTHVAGLPMIGSNLFAGPDTFKNASYSFGGGFKAGVETTLEIKDRLRAGLNAAAYWLCSYENPGRRSRMGMLVPRLSVNLTPRISVGTEHFFYFNKKIAEDRTTVFQTNQQHQFFAEFHFPAREK